MVDQEKMKEIRRGLLKFKLDLLKYEPLYGNLLMRMEILEDYGVRWASMDGIRIFYNPDYFAFLTEAERNYVLMHELFHIFYFHWEDQKGRDPWIWNIACDYAMKEDLHWRELDLSKVRVIMTPPKEYAYLQEKYDGKSEEFYYRALQDENRGKLFSSLTAYGMPVRDVPDDLERSGELTARERETIKDRLRELLLEVTERRGDVKKYLSSNMRSLLDQGVLVRKVCREEEAALMSAAEQFLDGTGEAPEEPSEAMKLIEALANKVSYLCQEKDYNELTPEQAEETERVIFSMFRMGKPEFTILGFQKLLEMNRIVVKRLFYEKDHPEADRFVREYFGVVRVDDLII